jgi:hypothetical protein
MYVPQNLWSLILKNMSGRELAQVYGTNKTVRNLINSNNVLYKRWRNARNLHHKANRNIYANLNNLRKKLHNNPTPANRKKIQNIINLFENEQKRRAKKRG